MKNCKQLFASLLLLGSSLSATAQTLFSTRENLDINHFNVGHMVHGDMWYDPSTFPPACEYPKGTGKHASYLASLWMAGKDDLGNLHLSAQTYRSLGADYWPGPLDAIGSLSISTSTKWAKIWKVNASTIADFKSLYSSGGSAALTAAKFDVIKEWPAKGNIDAKGNAGAGLTITNEMAPFEDVNMDGIYNWKDGDYPKIKGDQMLWWVFSDNGPTHSATDGLPLRVEYHVMAYGYNRGTDVDRIIFYEFLMHNKSTLRYNDFRFGLFSDADLGAPFDDYIAFDSAHRMGIEYNASKPDAPNGANSYGANPPLTGLSFIEMPGDIFPTAMLPAGTFNYFDNASTGVYKAPAKDSQFYHIMNAKGADGTPRYFGNYAYPITKGAVMCDSSFPPADKRYIITSNNYAFQPGTKAKIAMAFMATDTLGYACPLSSFKPITDLADTAWKIYWNPLPLSISKSIATKQTFKLYPNPAESSLYLETPAKASKEESIRIIDALGKTIILPVLRKANQFEINTSSLAAGVYSVIYFDGVQSSSQHFVKQ